MEFYKRHKYLIISLITVIAIMAVSGYAAFAPYKKKQRPPNPKTALRQIKPHKKNAPDKLSQITLKVGGKTYQTRIPESYTVYDLMNKLTKETNLTFKAKNFGGAMGYFIEEINGIKNNNGKYWIYYINNKKALTGISNYIIKPNDIIIWKYEKTDKL